MEKSESETTVYKQIMTRRVGLLFGLVTRRFFTLFNDTI